MFAWSLLAVGGLGDDPRPRPQRLQAGVQARGHLRPRHARFQSLLAVTTGWDPVGTFHATTQVYEIGIASRRPYRYWLFGSPTAFFLSSAPRSPGWRRSGWPSEPEAIAIFSVIGVACVLGFTKAETERIWLFLIPFVCLAAAPLVRRPTLLVGVLALQAVVYELLFDTLW